MAAGLGTRMKSDQAKVLHRLGGQPLIAHVCRGAIQLGPDRLVVVVGHQADGVEAAARDALGGAHPTPEFVLQEQQLGTGHAVLKAADRLQMGTVLVLSGDVPLVETETLRELLSAHRDGGYAATLLSTRLHDPSGYGRIVRGPAGDFRRIVEHRDCNPLEISIDEINAGIYAFEASHLVPAVKRLSTANAQHEYYLTDVLGAFVDDGLHVGVLLHSDPHEVLGINTRADLADSEQRLRLRSIERLFDAGVTIVDPATTYVDAGVEVGRDSVLMPGVMLSGTTRIGEHCSIGPWSHINDCVVADNVVVKAMTVLDGATIAAGATVGPFARLRPGARLGPRSLVGNFVEVKNSTLGADSKASHLTYLGDAEVGERCNIGAGTVTCNYDGRTKHRTVIEDEVSIGSDTMLVAPVRVGRKARTAAGAVVIRDVPERSLVVGVPAVVKRSPRDDED
jgi:bifunctional UDP-N-acetylglucosamine pyrophosphorylase/glucosamine-1-phosphate N-acetyltransferase